MDHVPTAVDARTDSMRNNERHYDAVYRHVNVEQLVATVRNASAFLEEAIATDTSWHGMYHGGFQQQLAGRCVLELGCGNGLNSLIMAALGAQVMAVDICKESQRIIEQAAALLPATAGNILAKTADFTLLPLDDCNFDLVVGKAFLHHLPHDQECEYLHKIARILKPSGEARFFEPAVNSRTLDWIRWRIPVPGRPSKINRRAFAQWKARDPHPERDNSTAAFVARARGRFGYVEAVPMGSIERIHRLLPGGRFNRAFRRWAHQVEPKLPDWFRYRFARSQLLVYREPQAGAFTVQPSGGPLEAGADCIRGDESGLAGSSSTAC